MSKIRSIAYIGFAKWH